MEITEVRVKLMEDTDDRLQAFCSITFDHAFVVRDLKIIDGTNGPFVAMPSRKLTSHCPVCKAKNHLRAAYCNHCGAKQREDRLHRDMEGRAKLYADIAHPINARCREMIQTRVIAEYLAERERAKQPGYISRYDDDYMFDAGEEYDAPAELPPIDSQSVPNSINETRLDQPHAAAEPHRPAVARPDEARTPHQKPHSKTERRAGEFGAGIFD